MRAKDAAVLSEAERASDHEFAQQLRREQVIEAAGEARRRSNRIECAPRTLCARNWVDLAMQQSYRP
jgi:hypothetical protein